MREAFEKAGWFTLEQQTMPREVLQDAYLQYTKDTIDMTKLTQELFVRYPQGEELQTRLMGEIANRHGRDDAGCALRCYIPAFVGWIEVSIAAEVYVEEDGKSYCAGFYIIPRNRLSKRLRRYLTAWIMAKGNAHG